MSRWLIIGLAALCLAMVLRAQEALLAQAAPLGITVDGSALSFAAPQILIYKETPDAQFVSALWKDATGRPLHQRSVLLMKSGYGIVVDYLDAKGQLVRAALPAKFLPIDSPPGSPLATGFDAGAGPKFAYVKPANPKIIKCEVALPGGKHDEVAISWEPRPLHLGGKEFHGWVAILHNGLDSTEAVEIK